MYTEEFPPSQYPENLKFYIETMGVIRDHEAESEGIRRAGRKFRGGVNRFELEQQ